MIIRCIDFETTGIPSELQKHAVCEVGWCDIDGMVVSAPCSLLVNPGRPIPFEAMAVHHIRDMDVANAPSSDKAFTSLMSGADVFSAHNAAFERQFFAGGDKPWICTYRCAMRAWPELPGHSNQVLRYALNLKIDEVLASPPHRAGPDAYISAHILLRLLGQASVEQLIKWTSEPIILGTVRFGKHRGQNWSSVPRDYLDWLLRQTDLDADVRHTAKYYSRPRTNA